jgi:hypothetical protein
MNFSNYPRLDHGRAVILQAMAAIALTLAAPGAANADGYSNPDQARAECEKRGKAGSQAELKKCCEGLILVADTKQQKKLEAQCAAPKAATRPSQGSAPASQVLKVS